MGTGVAASVASVVLENPPPRLARVIAVETPIRGALVVVVVGVRSVVKRVEVVVKTDAVLGGKPYTGYVKPKGTGVKGRTGAGNPA